MARIDRRAIGSGTPGIDLMEAAGRGAARVLQGLTGGLAGRSLAVLCGKGNNGGDGFVLSRLATAAGAGVRTFLFARRADVRGDAQAHLRLAEDAGCRIHEVTAPAGLAAVESALQGSDAAVDALLGTGIQGGARGITAQGIELLSRAACDRLAIDVPSGLDADTGRAVGPCAAATATATFGQPKIGQFLYPGRNLCGALHLVDIGLPDVAVAAEPPDTYLSGVLGGASLLPVRKPQAHKGDCGRVLIVAGSVGLTGAAALSARAAVVSGAGLVTVGVPESLNDVLEVKLTEAMTHPLPEVKKAGCLSLRSHGEIRRALGGADCVALGPGLRTHRETVELLHRLLPDIVIPAVLDADALNAFAGEPSAFLELGAPAVITPHPGEFCRLTGEDLQTVLDDPLAAARGLAAAAGVVVVLKCAPAVVACPSGVAYVNPSGNAGMATGGAGDVLTGLIASLVGQGLPVEEAATLGAYLHGLSGDLAAEALGQAGVAAPDLVTWLPTAEKRVRAGQDTGRYLRHDSRA